MSEEYVSKESASSASVTAEGGISKEGVVKSVASVAVLSQLINNSPELKSVFSTVDASQFDVLAQKILATDDVAMLVNKVASTPEIINIAGSLPADIDFSGLKTIFKLWKILPEDFEISETIAGVTEAAGEAFSDAAETGGEVLSTVAETGGEAWSIIAEIFSSLLSA